MKLIIEIDEDDYTMCQILANEMCDTRMKLTDNLKYAISNGIPLDKIRAELINRYPKNYAGELDLGGSACHFSLNEILEIIDKYRNGVDE